MPQRPIKQQGSNANAPVLALIIGAAARSLALSVEVFVRRGFGSGYVGCGLFAFVLMFFFVQFFPNDNGWPMAVFAGIYCVLWLIATINVLIRRWRRTETVHSRYSGHSHLSLLLPSWKERNVKYLEMLLVTVLGVGIHHLNRPLGDYVMLAAVFALLRNYGVASMIRIRSVEMNDAVIEQKQVADEFREMQQE
jgi:hypothetical protein